MKELPKLGRGRPTKAMAAKIRRINAENAREAAKSLEEREEVELDLLLDRPIYEPRQTKLQPDEETLKTVFTMAKLKCTHAEIAAVLGVERSTFTKFLDYHPVARETFEAGHAFYLIWLRRKQRKIADKQVAMPIFLGKSDLGQKDVVEVKNLGGKDGAAGMSNDELMSIIKRGDGLGSNRPEKDTVQ